MRLDRISAVRVGAQAPMLDGAGADLAEGPDRTADGAVPMPAPVGHISVPHSMSA